MTKGKSMKSEGRSCGAPRAATSHQECGASGSSKSGAISSTGRQSRLARGLLIQLIGFASLALAVVILPGISAHGWVAILLAQGIIVALNAVLWPVLVSRATVLLVWTAGLAALGFNAAALMLASHVIAGFSVDTWWNALGASLIVTAASAGTAASLAIDDEDVYRRNLIRKMAKRAHGHAVESDEPGLIMIQIDGLGIPVLEHALTSGHMPNLASWLRSGSHQLHEWECDLSSQTGASQAGILHGDNHNMPAFRWLDKQTGHVVTTNRPRDAAAIEASRQEGRGLLVGGVSRSNVFTGGSDDSLFTFSTILTGFSPLRRGLEGFFADPYAMSRAVVLSLDDIAREIAASWRARRRRVEPRLRRGGVYPIARAATTVMLRDITIATLIADIYRGVPIAYVDLVGYDEVAHHSGVLAPDALEVLYKIDRQLGRVRSAADDGPRPYRMVVLSDHGQSQGATFRQRYGLGLADVVKGLMNGDSNIAEPQMPSEGLGNINGALTDVINDPQSRTGRLAGRLLNKRVSDGELNLGAHRREFSVGPDQDAVVLASGNLGLISFPDLTGRASLELITRRHPELIQGLVRHPGVGFVLVSSEAGGGIAIGADGVCYLDDGTVDGANPLAGFGPNVLQHLRRTHSFDNAPDILVNSFFDGDLNEGCAFEELIGFHGGLGGWQSRPFLLVPSELPLPADPIVGAASVNEVFRSWRSAPQHPKDPGDAGRSNASVPQSRLDYTDNPEHPDPVGR